MIQAARRLGEPAQPSTPTLDELAGDPTRAAALSVEERNQLLARCAAVLAALSAVSVIAPERSTDTHDDNASDPQRLLTVPEVATTTGFARSYVYELLRRGDLPAVRHKKYVRVRASALDQWIAEHEWHGRRAPVPGRASARTAPRALSRALDDGGASAPEAMA